MGGVSLPGGGGRGRNRNLNADLNLVPFIDLMSTCITFLLATAVWVQQSALEVEQSIQDPNSEPPPPEEEEVPPLMVHIRADGVWWGRNLEQGQLIPQVGESYDWHALDDGLKGDRDTYPEETFAYIKTDDGIHYQHMIAALDLTRKHGYEKTLLGGGPPATEDAATPAGG